MARGAGKSFPTKIEPMLCTLVKEIKDDPDFLYEVKWDGYRIIAYAERRKVRLASRGGLDYTAKYPLVAEAIQALDHEAVFDGEVVVFNKDGIPDFDALQLYNGYRTSIAYCVFDILWLDGHNLMELPLIQRKSVLKKLIDGNQVLKYSESFENGTELYQEMLDKGWEGIVAKHKESQYVPGQRGASWLKVPTVKRQEFVIGAWAESDKSRLFRSLLFGAYNEKGEFEWIGRSGGGYKHKEMLEIMAKLKALEIDKSPFKNKILDTKGAVIHYVKPVLVANFAFATWTKSGRIRKPATFLGFREDKNPLDVVREVPKEVITTLNGEETDESFIDASPVTKSKPSNQRVYLNDDSNWKDLDNLPIEDERELPVDSYQVKVHDLGKVLWKHGGITKADLMSYYAAMADIILPYLKDRPLSVYIKHISPTAPGLYIKDFEGRAPEFAEVFETKRKHKKEGKRDIIEYFVINNVASLLYLVNLGAIDINPWSSRTVSSESPDYITIDLDPSDGDFKKAIETALAAKDLFDEYGIKALPKTSGKTGMHLLIPCSGFTFPEARSLGTLLCDEVQKLVPAITTRERSVGHRGDRLYVDDSQNDYADTIASAYSVRPFRIPTVSTPLEWTEINDSLDAEWFTINTIQKRIEDKGDVFSSLFDKKVIESNNQALRKLRYMF